MKYSQHYGTRKTSQSEPIPGSKQVKNHAGGYAYAIDDWTRLRRFLILGSEGGTYYQNEKTLTVENAEAVRRCLEADPGRALEMIADVSHRGLAPKNEPAIFALAMGTHFVKSNLFRRAAFDALPVVCRTGTHLFRFVEYRQAFSGWGRGMRRAVRDWYLKRDVDSLAHQLAKYQARDGWSHRDVLRLAHPKSPLELVNNSLCWAVGKTTTPKHRLLDAMRRAHDPGEKFEVIKLISDHGLTREMIPTELLSDPDVQRALMEGQGLTALIRNLGNYSKSGLLKPMSEAEWYVIERLSSGAKLAEARVHPFQVLLALKTYAQGHGFRGTGEWKVCPKVIDALDAAFYESFNYVEGAGKRFLLGLDVSGSMGGEISGSPLSCREASAAMAMITMRLEPACHAHGFSTRFVDLGISPRMRLDDIVRKINHLPFEGTDCALPMLYAAKEKLYVDTFVVYTDNETWAGSVHPKQALDAYRQKTGLPARLVVCAFTSSEFSIADPDDAGMLDCAGLDASLPRIIKGFSAGEI